MVALSVFVEQIKILFSFASNLSCSGRCLPMDQLYNSAISAGFVHDVTGFVKMAALTAGFFFFFFFFVTLKTDHKPSENLL